MQNKVIKRLSDEIIESTKKVGGIKEFVKLEENKGKIVNWLELITDVSCLFEEKNGFEMTLGFKKYHNCYFKVNTYGSAMYIGVYGIKDNGVDTEDYFIDNVTIYNYRIDYSKEKITVKEEYVKTLKKLGIIIDSMPKIGYADKNFALCTIDIEKLKGYCKDWNYKYE